MFRGVYILKTSTPSLHDRTIGAWLTSNRTGVISGVAASALHGAGWVDDGHPIEILVDERRRQPGLVVRMDRVADDEIVTLNDLPATTPNPYRVRSGPLPEAIDRHRPPRRTHALRTIQR
jgi:hypothetical protein